jgi:RND family efflux transporter MFP subunit
MKYILSTFVILLFMTGCTDDEGKEKIRPVRTIKLVPTAATSAHIFNGIARSDIAAHLSFNVNGTIKKVYVRDGQHVKEGDIIASLNDSYFKLKVDEVKATLKQARSKLNNEKSRYNRIKKLYVNRSSSLSDLDNSRTAKDSAYANYKAIKNRLEQAQLELSYTKLRAPMNGSISDLHIHKGENVTPALSIASISSTQSIDVPISIPGSLIDNIKEGDRCEVHFDALKNKTFDAEVIEVSHASSQRTTTFPVVVRLLKKNRRVHPGMSASVRFNFHNNVLKNSFVVPVHALLENENGTYLYIVDEINKEGIGTIKRQNVKRGELTTNGIVIMSGVHRDTHVLTAGMSRVHENQHVRVKN